MSEHITLGAGADGSITAGLGGRQVPLGTFSHAAAERARKLSEGIPLASFERKRGVDAEIDLLVRRLAAHNFLEYRLTSPKRDRDLVVIEPQVPGYWPQTPKLASKDTVVLSRFAYLRRRGNDMVLESPNAGALFRICDPHVGNIVAALARPQKVSWLRRQAFDGLELLPLLLDCQILFKLDAKNGDGLRVNEGDANLVLWDFHDLLFHTRGTEGRHANPVGGFYAYADIIPPLPAVRPRWPGQQIKLNRFSSASTDASSAFPALLRQRHSIRDFDDERPITLAELARFLDATAHVLSEWKPEHGNGGGSPEVTYSTRPYPSAGSAYELELYLAAVNCEGLPRGFYHYDAGGHGLVSIAVTDRHLEALTEAAAFAMDSSGPPQVLITVAARFGRISWKYSAIAYSLVLKDVGALIQTFYLMATEMGLGGCAVGTTNIEQFAQMTGLPFHVESPVGQFALGRGNRPDNSR